MFCVIAVAVVVVVLICGLLCKCVCCSMCLRGPGFSLRYCCMYVVVVCVCYALFVMLKRFAR